MGKFILKHKNTIATIAGFFSCLMFLLIFIALHHLHMLTVQDAIYFGCLLLICAAVTIAVVISGSKEVIGEETEPGGRWLAAIRANRLT